mgnify:CR=1 FL=1
MKLIVGLGNPGREYAGTRHNIGFGLAIRLADRHQIPLRENQCKAVYGKGRIHGESVIIAQPMTFMNLSGEAVRGLADYYKILPEDIIVASDDIALPVGQIRIRKKGSAGGHNGLKDIIRHLGTDAFIRVRIGVGDKPENGNLVRHVLGRLSKTDEKIMDETLEVACDAVEDILQNGAEHAMNLYNKKAGT